MAVATLLPIEEYLSTCWDPDREYVAARADRLRIPDVLAVRQMPSGRFLRRPPYIAVEVLSPDDRTRDLDDKIDDYPTFGVENIWVIDPGRSRVTVWTRDGGRICLDAVDTPDGEFSILLSEIFADMPSTEDQ
jgi:Uma2 family endonuclease